MIILIQLVRAFICDQKATSLPVSVPAGSVSRSAALTRFAAQPALAQHNSIPNHVPSILQALSCTTITMALRLQQSQETNVPKGRQYREQQEKL